MSIYDDVVLDLHSLEPPSIIGDEYICLPTAFLILLIKLFYFLLFTMPTHYFSLWLLD